MLQEQGVKGQTLSSDDLQQMQYEEICKSSADAGSLGEVQPIKSLGEVQPTKKPADAVSVGSRHGLSFATRRCQAAAALRL